MPILIKKEKIYFLFFYAKGANKLDDLRNKILTKFGFRKVWIEKHGKFIELWGEFNPKVILMREDGTVEFRELDKDDLKILGNDKQIGKTVRNNGIVVSDNFKAKFDAGEVTKTYDELLNMSEEARRVELMSSKMAKRMEYMGATPNKASKQGREVIERMRLQGKIKDEIDGMFFHASDGQ